MEKVNYLVYATDERMKIAARLMESAGKKVFIDATIRPNNNKAVFVFAPNKLVSEVVANLYSDGDIIFAKDFSEEFLNYANKRGVKAIKYSSVNEFVSKNSDLTADALFDILSKTVYRMPNKHSLLVIGYGNLGKAVTLGAITRGYSVCVATSRINSVECGIKAINVNEINYKLYDVVVNTAPKRQINSSALKDLADRNGVLIELASKPYGFLEADANEIGLSYNILPALPARFYPDKAAQVVVETVERYVL